ncbi:MAG TPA: lipid-A-disaccharide synthase N-terminal domain-containing protein [Candidatus Hydrogenedens sp.]|nr:lipid-A-disaccharide synthase N-terminal domain-containing protein [Candidatus Hydrogenedens sp.]
MIDFSDWNFIWQTVGVIGAVIFFGRFYIQWIWSEKLGRSVIPIIFWYMSSVGSILLLGYGVYILSPVGVVSYGFNLLVYARNLIHIWRKQNKLTPFRYYLTHGLVLLAFIVSTVVVCYVFYQKFFHVREMAKPHAVRYSFWIFLGLMGQILFAFRFLIQWLTTEVKKQSVIPPIFWYLSLLASFLQIISYSFQKEWLYAIGLLTTLFVYFRNIWLLKKGTKVLSANGE